MASTGARIRLFDYRGAARSAEQARSLAVSIHDNLSAGAATVNIATIYQQIGDYLQADREAEHAIALLKDNRDSVAYLAKARLLYASAEAERIRRRADLTGNRERPPESKKALDEIAADYQSAVDTAHAGHDSSLECEILEELAEAMLIARHPERAREPLRRAHALESAIHNQDGLVTDEQHQAELELQLKNYAKALELLEHLNPNSSYFRTVPPYWPLFFRGMVLHGLKRDNEALVQLRSAVAAADAWRLGTIAGDATSTQMVVTLNDVYQEFVLLAAHIAYRTHDPALTREAFEVMAFNRAANLRDQIASSLGQKFRLPAQYFDLLAELQSVQARLSLGDGTAQDQKRISQIRLDLGRIENELGIDQQNFSAERERNAHKNLLRNIQGHLNGREVLLDFCLGQEESFLWAITGDQLSLYQLTGEDEIARSAKTFTRAIEHHDKLGDAGMTLSRTLFGTLNDAVWKRPEWLIVPDGVLLDGVPFAMLSDLSANSGKSLTCEHVLRFLPASSLLSSPRGDRPQSRFVGVGDPIYNLADSRYRRKSSDAKPNASAIALVRLPGSEREVRAAAEQSGMRQTELLIGPDASLDDLQKAIAKRPEILHFAVHVVPSSIVGKSDLTGSDAALALSLSPGNVPELLTSQAIATLRTPGTLVILSGCSSQRGERMPSAGVMGLSRAWLLAGATAVIVSAWPTPDDSGQFFTTFYAKLAAHGNGTLAQRASVALQQTQLQMQHQSGYRSLPNFWAAYSIISKE